MYSGRVDLNCRGRDNVYQLKGNFERAIVDYTEAIRLSPKQSRIYLNCRITHFYSKVLVHINDQSRPT